MKEKAGRPSLGTSDVTNHVIWLSSFTTVLFCPLLRSLREGGEATGGICSLLRETQQKQALGSALTHVYAAH